MPRSQIVESMSQRQMGDMKQQTMEGRIVVRMYQRVAKRGSAPRREARRGCPEDVMGKGNGPRRKRMQHPQGDQGSADDRFPPQTRKTWRDEASQKYREAGHCGEEDPSRFHTARVPSGMEASDCELKNKRGRTQRRSQAKRVGTGRGGERGVGKGEG